MHPGGPAVERSWKWQEGSHDQFIICVSSECITNIMDSKLLLLKVIMCC